MTAHDGYMDPEVKAEPAGAGAKPPKDQSTFAMAEDYRLICPMTEKPCERSCIQPAVRVQGYLTSVGRTFCALWINQKREEGIGNG